MMLATGIANMVLVHPVPGLAYLFLSLVYLPPANHRFTKQFGLSMPLVVKLALAVIIILFTFGVSDLGDMIDG